MIDHLKFKHQTALYIGETACSSINSNSDHNLNPSVQQKHKDDKSFQVQPVKDSVSTNAKQNYITRSDREVKPLRSLSKNEWVMQTSHD